MTDTTTANSEPNQPLGLALTDPLGQLPTSSEDEASVLARLSKTPAEAYERGYLDGYAKCAADERAWFVRVLKEWDRTTDVEEILAVRLEHLSGNLCRCGDRAKRSCPGIGQRGCDFRA